MLSQQMGVQDRGYLLARHLGFNQSPARLSMRDGAAQPSVLQRMTFAEAQYKGITRCCIKMKFQFLSLPCMTKCSCGHQGLAVSAGLEDLLARVGRKTKVHAESRSRTPHDTHTHVRLAWPVRWSSF